MKDQATALAQRPDTALQRQTDDPVADIVERARIVKKALERSMKKDVHYGVIPGTGNKPTLYQPGAEKLFLLFQLAPELDVEDLTTEDAIRYRVRCLVRSIATGDVVGMGVGEASSDEEKYRWRGAVCDEEFDETPESRRRVKWKKGFGNKPPQKIKQVRTEPADIANTVLKMAAKRARVDAAKSTTAASDVFDQDLEDLVATGIELEREREAESQIKEPQAKPAGGAPRQQRPRPQAQQQRDDEPPPPEDPNGGPPSAGYGGASNGAGEATGVNFDHPLLVKAADSWHERGVISEKQANRLFRIARTSGWSSESVNRLVRDVFNVDVNAIPWGGPYEAIVEYVQAEKP